MRGSTCPALTRLFQILQPRQMTRATQKTHQGLPEHGGGGAQYPQARLTAFGRHDQVIRVAALRPCLQIATVECVAAP